jgi:hypothetical protein
VTLTRRSLLAALGVTLPVALTAAGAEAATVHALHHHKKHHARAISARAHHRKTRHATAAVAHPRTQA